MTEYTCTCDATCVEYKRTQVTPHPKSTTAILNNVRRLIETIGAEAIEIYRWNNNPQPQFSNRGVRVIIRPDRIDLA